MAISNDECCRFVNLAIKAFVLGDYLESKVNFEKVLKIDPEDVKAKNSIVQIGEKIEKLGLKG